MRLIVAGSRQMTSYKWLSHEVRRLQSSGLEITEIVSGGAKGTDRLGERWARSHRIPIKLFRPDWREFGKAAGPIRNKAMAEYGNMLLAFWDGESRGTKNMIEQAKNVGIPIRVVTYKNKLPSFYAEVVG